jgi:hypothetical protein
MVVKEPVADRAAEESPLSLTEKGVTVEEKQSLVAEERLRRNLLGPLIKYIFVRASFSPIAFSSLPYSLAPRLISLAPPATWEELWVKNLASVLEYMRSYRYLLPLTFKKFVLLEVLERFQVQKTLCAREI